MTDITTAPPSAFNVNRVAPETKGTPQSGPHKDANRDGKTRFADKPTVRSIPPMTKYDSESGTVEIDTEKSTWLNRSATPKVAATVAEETDDTTTTDAPTDTTDRRTKWKEQQAAKKQERDTKKNEKFAQTQVLAKDLLQKGDLVGAAKALNMTPTDLITYMDNARLSIPNETEKPLSKEEQHAKDEEKFRADRLAFEEEQKAFRYQTVMQKYVSDKITPVLADKDKFELISQVNGDQSITNYIYEYLNKHYGETGEELNAQDVAETIEEQLFNARKESLESAKKTKKLAQYFTADQLQEMADEAREDETRPATSRKVSLSQRMNSQLDQFYEPTLENSPTVPVNSRFMLSQEPDDAELEEIERLETQSVPKRQATIRKSGNMNVSHPIFLPKAERLAQIRGGRY